MKILQVNQYHYPRGGADKYFLELTQALETAGHQVAVFAMDHPKNWPTPWSRYFVSRVSFNNQTLKDKLKTPGRVLYSLETKRNFSRLVEDFQPDIIHVHNIYHHLSPSLLTVAKKKKIPVVMHLQDYKLICANHTLFTKGAYCERCRPNRYYQCLKNRCVKNSWSGSALAMAEMYLHHSILKIYETGVDIFIAPSYFMKEATVRFGHPAEKIQVIYNTYSPELLPTTDEEKIIAQDYLLYFGRLSPEKGINTLIAAATLTGQKTKIVGDGPEEENLKKLVKELRAPVEFLSFKNSTQLRPLIMAARAVVIPSIWGENMPLSLMEALSLGKIAIVSNIGGMPEVIKNGQTGLLFEPGNAQDLARQIKRLTDLDPIALAESGRNIAAEFSPAKNLEKILAVYRKLIK